MEFFGKKAAPEAQTDDIPEKIHKRLHIIYFFLKCVIGAAVFLTFYNRLCVIFLDIPDLDTEDSPFLRHEYCGTFYVEINSENSFASQEAYDAYLEKQNTPSEGITAADIVKAAVVMSAALAAAVMLITKKFPPFISRRAAVFVLIYGGCFLIMPEFVRAGSVFCYVLLFLALRCGDKKTIFRNKASDYFLTAGTVLVICTVFGEITVIIGTKTMDAELSGVFSHPTYYCQIYDLFAIPLILLCAGLMLRRHELDLCKGGSRRNSAALNGAGYAALAGTAGFVLWRLCVRVIEVISVLTGGGYTVRLPFTVMETPCNKLIDLPRELAKTPQDYTNAVLFRFAKDFPVFVLSALAVVFFVRVLFAMSRGELNTAANRRRLNVCMILLLAASLWFNIMGIPELGFFNNGFTGVYGEVVYTIALRSKTEPALFALVLWFFKTYMQTIPESADG